MIKINISYRRYSFSYLLMLNFFGFLIVQSYMNHIDNPFEIFDYIIWNRNIAPFPIDLVYLWVNSSDMSFVATRAQAAKANGINITKEAIKKDTDIGEIIYSLRSVEKYLHWIHKIYILSSTPKPSWFDFNHPQLEFIDTKEILPEGITYFDSSRLELRFPYIPGLSEYYLFMADDYFFGDYISWEAFYTNDGMPRYRNPQITNISDSDLPGVTKQFQNWTKPNQQNSILYWACEFQSLLQCRNEFNVNCRFKNFHIAFPYRKSFFFEADEKLKNNNVLLKMKNSSFRTGYDIIPEVIFGNYNILLKGAEYYFVNETNYFHANEIYKLPEDGKANSQIFVINTGIDTTNEQKLNISRWLQIFMPNKSKFEF